MSKTPVLDIYGVKEHKICKQYYYDIIGKKVYIRPFTVKLFKPINSEYSREIYYEAYQVLRKQMNIREAGYIQDCINNGAKREFNMAKEQLLKSVDIKYVIECITASIEELSKPDRTVRLSESDRQIIEERITLLMGIYPNPSDLPTFLRFALDMDYSYDIEISTNLIKSYYTDADVTSAFGELIEIGRVMSSYSYNEINTLNFATDDMEFVEKKIMEFVHKFGLLGICNSIFTISGDIVLTRITSDDIVNIAIAGNPEYTLTFEDIVPIGIDMNAANVLTFMGKVRQAIETPEKIIERHIISKRVPLPDNDIMNVMEYIRIFFPDESHMSDYWEYAQMDNRYHTRYSEPMNLFLMAARMLFEELECYKHILESPYLSFNGMSMSTGYDDEYKSEFYRFQFHSLIDAIRYFAFFGLKNNPNYFRCKQCHKLVSKIDNRRREFCSTKCSNSYGTAKFRKKKARAKAQKLNP